MIKEVGTGTDLYLYPIGYRAGSWEGHTVIRRTTCRDKPDEIGSVVFARAVELMPFSRQ